MTGPEVKFNPWVANPIYVRVVNNSTGAVHYQAALSSAGRFITSRRHWKQASKALQYSKRIHDRWKRLFLGYVAYLEAEAKNVERIEGSGSLQV